MTAAVEDPDVEAADRYCCPATVGREVDRCLGERTAAEAALRTDPCFDRMGESLADLN